MAQRLAKELWDAARNEGKAVGVREQTHRMAEANRAFARAKREGALNTLILNFSRDASGVPLFISPPIA